MSMDYADAIMRFATASTACAADAQSDLDHPQQPAWGA
jgi:hypothetical protein